MASINLLKLFLPTNVDKGSLLIYTSGVNITSSANHVCLCITPDKTATSDESAM